MSKYLKTVVPADETALRDRVMNWAALHDVNVLDTHVQDATMKVVGKKTYHSKRRFNIGLFVLWIVIGVIISALVIDPDNSEYDVAGGFFLLAIPAGYVIYHFVRGRTRTVEFEILSREMEGKNTLKISASDDFDEVKADVNALATTML